MPGTVDVARVIDNSRMSALQYRVVAICLAVVFADGFDVQAISYIAPMIARDWQLGRGALGPVFSAGLFGLMLGSLILAPSCRPTPAKS